MLPAHYQWRRMRPVESRSPRRTKYASFPPAAQWTDPASSPSQAVWCRILAPARAADLLPRNACQESRVVPGCGKVTVGYFGITFRSRRTQTKSLKQLCLPTVGVTLVTLLLVTLLLVRPSLAAGPGYCVVETYKLAVREDGTTRPSHTPRANCTFRVPRMSLGSPRAPASLSAISRRLPEGMAFPGSGLRPRVDQQWSRGHSQCFRTE